MPLTRDILFLSYSRADRKWRDLFLAHLRTIMPPENIWIDTTDIPAGDEWRSAIEAGISTAKCALVLLTEKFIERGSFTRETELPLILDARRSEGLQVLLVLVRSCAWQAVEGLSEIELVSWSETTERQLATRSSKDRMLALEEAGNGSEHEQARVVIQICTQAARTMGVYRGIGRRESASLCEDVRSRLAVGDPTHSIPPIYASLDETRSGQFSVVLFGKMSSEDIAVKIVPPQMRHTYVDTFFNTALAAAPKLREPPFVYIHFGQSVVEPHFVVMERVGPRTLAVEIEESLEKRLTPLRVAALLSELAQAQHVAHRAGLPLGPVSPKDIYVGDNLRPKISPLRMESQLARCASLAAGQHISWDMLSWLTPESYRNLILAPEQYDAAEQYYLGLLGLELLSGRRAITVKCFADLRETEQLFRDPRAQMANSDGRCGHWIDESPALAFIIGERLLNPDLNARYESAERARDELRDVAKGKLPQAVIQTVTDSFHLVSDESFVKQFYSRLEKEPVGARFVGKHDQHRRFLAKLEEFVGSDPDGKIGAARKLAYEHRGYRLSRADIDVFQRAFVEEVVTVSSSLSLGDAWQAFLTKSFRHFLSSSSEVDARDASMDNRIGSENFGQHSLN